MPSSNFLEQMQSAFPHQISYVQYANRMQRVADQLDALPVPPVQRTAEAFGRFDQLLRSQAVARALGAPWPRYEVVSDWEHSPLHYQPIAETNINSPPETGHKPKTFWYPKPTAFDPRHGLFW